MEFDAEQASELPETTVHEDKLFDGGLEDRFNAAINGSVGARRANQSLYESASKRADPT